MPGAGQATGLEALFWAAATVACLCACGRYATGRLLGLASGGAVGRGLFYALVAPGVALHETAHLLVCLATGTRVARFAPFSPRAGRDGRIVLGQVDHERRNPLIEAAVGLGPMVLNPLGVLAVTALLTPISPYELLSAASPLEGLGRIARLVRGEAAHGTSGPLVLLAWAYLAGSFALGSVPSSEDLGSVPAAALLVACAGAAISLYSDAGRPLVSAGAEAASAVGGLYALPAAAALCLALAAFLGAAANRSAGAA